MHGQQAVRNGGTRRPLPLSQFPLVPREELRKSVEGRLLPVPRQGMLAASVTEATSWTWKSLELLKSHLRVLMANRLGDLGTQN